MVRAACVDRNGVRKGAWSEEEDRMLRDYVLRYGHWNWRLLPKYAGLNRCGKSCRLRWMNYLKPGLKRGDYTIEEAHLINKLHHQLGHKWSAIAAYLPGRTDNEIKNYWHTHFNSRRGKRTAGKPTQKNPLGNKNSLQDSSDDFQKPAADDVYILESSSSSSCNSAIANDLDVTMSLSSQPSSDSSVVKSMMAESDGSSSSSDPFSDSFWDEEPFVVDTSFIQEFDFSSSSCNSAAAATDLDSTMSSQPSFVVKSMMAESDGSSSSSSDPFSDSLWDEEPFVVDTSFIQEFDFSVLDGFGVYSDNYFSPFDGLDLFYHNPLSVQDQ